jgi:hypothetical protein
MRRKKQRGLIFNVGEDVTRYSETPLEFLETPGAEESLANYQDRPSFPDNIENMGNGPPKRVKFFRF